MMQESMPRGGIVALADPDSVSEAVPAASWLAARHGVPLTVLSCVAPPADLAAIAQAAQMAPPQFLDRLVQVRRDAMVQALDAAMPDPPPLHVTTGRAYVEVTRHVLRHGSAAVVKRAEPLIGLSRLFHASTDQHLMRKCPCPVWLLAPGAPARPHTVLAAVDVDDADASEPATLAALNAQVLAHAARLAAPEGVVHVLHAWDAPGEGMVWAFAAQGDPRAAAARYADGIEETRRAALARLLAAHPQPGPALRPVLVRGPVAQVIPQQAADLGADAVVLGTVARTGVAGILIGNTAEDLMNALDGSILAVKPPGFVSPFVDLR